MAPEDKDMMARREILETLDQEVREKQPGLRCGLVVREGSMVLFVINSADSRKRAEIGCEYQGRDGWWFTWVTDGSTIGPAEDVVAVGDVIARELQAEAATQRAGS